MDLIRRLASRVLSSDRKRQIKSVVHAARMAYVRRMRSYGHDDLVAALRGLGVREGDALMVHARFVPQNGFRESPARAVGAMLAAVGDAGTLLFSTVPYESTTDAYVKSAPTFDVRRTPSRMGILSEMVRRHKSARRSAHPAHPVAAVGPDAEWFVCGHERSEFSCGPETPWARLVERNAKMLFFDIGVSSMTLLHYLEHTFSDQFPVSMYAPESTGVRVIDQDGTERLVAVRAFSADMGSHRRIAELERELRAQRHVRAARVGNTKLQIVAAADAMQSARALSERGEFR